MVSKIEFGGATFVVPVSHIDYLGQSTNGDLIIVLKTGRTVTINDGTSNRKVITRIFRELVEDLDLYIRLTDAGLRRPEERV